MRPSNDEPEADRRFELRGQLGTGGMGIVYRAHDRELGREVALKALGVGGARELYRFKREFRSLADLSHPNLVGLYELHTRGDQWLLTMELIDGVPFTAWVRPAAPVRTGFDEPTAPSGVRPPSGGAAIYGNAAGIPASARRWPMAALGDLDEARLRAALVQLVDGVSALHAAGKIHRDLKPSNVLVEPSGRVVILDFGLITESLGTQVDYTHERSAVGTPAYMSPEQAADLPLTDASDWYAVGVMLYEALTGRRPFEGPTSELMHLKQTTDPVPPEELESSAVADLSALCVRLLARDPQARPSGREILAALGAAPSPATERIAEEAARGPFVGRGDELAALREAWADSGTDTVLAALVGASGIGKSALLRTFLDEVARDPRAMILEGRCYERESVPYKALDAVIDALTSYLVGTPGALGDAPIRSGSLVRLFPVLRRVPSLAMAGVPTQGGSFRSGLAALADPLELRRHALDELRELLRRVTSNGPLLIAIDDLQWGDVDSAWALAELVREPDAPRLLLLLAHRSEDSEPFPVLAAFRRWNERPTRVVELPPLPEHDLRDLWLRLGGAADDEAPIDAAGSPLLLGEIARARARGDQHVTSVDQAVRSRLASLPSHTRRLLITIATAARPLPQEVAARAADLDDPISATLSLRTDRLIRVRASTLVEPFHDRIRETITALASPDELRAAHARLAEALSRTDSADREEVIEHWLDAGEIARAAAEAEAAAHQAEERVAFHRAADLYGLALRRDDLDDAKRRDLTARRADALNSAGRPIESAAEFRAAAELSSGRDRLTYNRRATEQLLRAGHLEDGFAAAVELLAEVGVKVPRTYQRSVLALIAASLRFRLRGMRFRERPIDHIDPAQLDRLDVLWSVSQGIAFVDPILGRVLQLRMAREALDTGELHRAVMSLSVIQGFLAMRGVSAHEQIQRQIAETRSLSERIDKPEIHGLIDGSCGVAAYLTGHFEEASRLIAQCEAKIPPSAPDTRWQLDLCPIFRLTALLALGNFREILRLHPAYLRDAEERGDVYALRALRGWRGNIAWLVRGEADEALAQAESLPQRRPDERFHLHHYYELVCRTNIDLYRGDGVGAHRRIESVWRELEGAHLLRIEVVRIEAQWLRGAAAIAASGEIPEALAVAKDQVRRLSALGAPMARVVRAQLSGAIARRRGDVAAAVAALREAIAAADAMAMAAHRTVAQLRLGELVGGDEGRRMVGEAIAWLSDQGVVEPTIFARVFGPSASER